MDKRNSQIEYVTIIGNSFDEVIAESRAQRLAQNDFSIVGPIARHQVTAAGDNALLKGGTGTFVSATFSKRI
jgi:hypothetical protein